MSKNTVMASMDKNRPRLRAESVQGVDAFGRSGFSRTVANALPRKAIDGSLVVGIEGAWGTGKTFVITQIKSILTELTPTPLVVEFNPWLVSGAASLVEALLDQLAASLQREAPTSMLPRALRAGKAILGYARGLRHLRHAAIFAPTPELSAAALAASHVGRTIDRRQKEAREAKAALTGYLKELDLQSIKAEVEQAILKLRRPIIVIIDDADRLNRSEIRVLVQAVKSVANFPGVTYLLSYDPTVFARALSYDEKYLREGTEYLEKIVQLAYPLPALFPWRMRTFVSAKLSDIIAEVGIKVSKGEQERWREAISFVARLCRHPRDVERICNRLRLVLPSTRDELLVSEVSVFQALAITRPELIAFILANPEKFVGDIPIGGEDFGSGFYWLQATAKLEREKGQSEESMWEKDLPGPLDIYALGALYFLFPREEHVAAEEISLLALRSWDRFCRLLAFSKANQIPEIAEIRTVLADSDSLRLAITQDLNEAISFLAWAEKYMPTISLPNPRTTLTELCSVSVQLNKSSVARNHSVFGSIGDLLTSLIQSQSIDREKASIEVIETACLSTSHSLVVHLKEDFPRHKRKKLFSNNSLASNLVDGWVSKVASTANHHSFISEPYFHSVLWCWAQLGREGFAPVRNAVASICSRVEGLQRFASYPRFNSSFPMELREFDLIWDRSEFVACLRKDSALAKAFDVLLKRLEDPQVVHYFEERGTQKVSEPK